MKRILTLTIFVSLFATACLASIEGSWTATLDDDDASRLDLSTSRRPGQVNGGPVLLASLQGLSASQVLAKATTPVAFAIAREAGTIRYEGTFRNGHGAGQFTFEPNRAALSAIRALGVDPVLDDDRRKKDEEEVLFTLAQFDVSSAYIRTMIAEGYRLPLEEYVSMRIFDVTPEFIHEMRSLGFKQMTSDDLVACRIHGVTPSYVREMRAAGWELSLDDLEASRIHGATPQFAAEMKKLGYDLAFDDLVAFRIHGVTRQFIESMRQLGYDRLSADDLVAFRIHDVTPEYIREFEAAGYTKIPAEKLIAMKIQGIDAKFVRNMRK